jgi:glyoxylase-like metal-dependent hydrolase (beta-lactamase superfamily II)
MTIPYDIFTISLPTPFTVGPVNCYLLTADPPILVDTGPRSAQAYEVLVSELNRHGFKLADLGSVLITHGHLDHVGQLACILRESKAAAFAHPSVVRQWKVYDEDRAETERFYAGVFRESGVPEAMVSEIVADREEYRVYGEPVSIDRTVKDGQAIGVFHARHVPGHSAGDTLFVDDARGILFTGDHLLKVATPFPLVRRPLAGQPRAKSLVELRESLCKTRSLNGVTAYPGHGRPFGDVPSVVDSVLERHERKTQHVFGILQRGPATPYQVCCALFSKVSVRTLHFALSAVMGYLEILEMRGVVVAEIRDGVQWCSRRAEPAD